MTTIDLLLKWINGRLFFYVPFLLFNKIILYLMCILSLLGCNRVCHRNSLNLLTTKSLTFKRMESGIYRYHVVAESTVWFPIL